MENSSTGKRQNKTVPSPARYRQQLFWSQYLLPVQPLHVYTMNVCLIECPINHYDKRWHILTTLLSGVYWGWEFSFRKHTERNIQHTVYIYTLVYIWCVYMYLHMYLVYSIFLCVLQLSDGIDGVAIAQHLPQDSSLNRDGRRLPMQWNDLSGHGYFSLVFLFFFCSFIVFFFRNQRLWWLTSLRGCVTFISCKLLSMWGWKKSIREPCYLQIQA